MHVSESLSFTGVRRLYHAADVLVSPYKAEGFNLPVLEAAASGLTVIVTLGGFVCRVSNNRSGSLGLKLTFAIS